tara:strand:- start:68 stop:334 length:267 start_codon:yes stop_codon:yes gene_type:complete
MKMEKYIICYLSELGHKNFWYPTVHKALILESLITSYPALVGGGADLIPAMIEIKNILPLTTSASYIKNNYTNNNAVVWINKPKITDY